MTNEPSSEPTSGVPSPDPLLDPLRRAYVDALVAAGFGQLDPHVRDAFRSLRSALAAAATVAAEHRAGSSAAERGTHNASDAGSTPAPPTDDEMVRRGLALIYDPSPTPFSDSIRRAIEVLGSDDA